MQNTIDGATQEAVLKELRQIPGIGKSLARDLWNLGFRSIEELRGQDPEEMYVKQCALQGTQVDRCVLYTFRCAVYYASNEEHDPELLKWWNWKDIKTEK
ncbi:MAG TPA: helix-hairpin-helix domain-containing protein [Ktedonobacteraceae bacterium]|nr:helix-hairpin-helix domain-containing protein [Ktedonobacteraceae bacterium]